MEKDEEDSWLAELGSAAPHYNFVSSKNIADAAKDEFKVALVANPNPSEVAQFANLKWVQSLWAGVERLMTDLPDERLAVSRLVDPQLAQTMSEAVLAWCLYLHRDMPQYKIQQTQKQWKPGQFVLAKDRRIGILGMGKLGEESAARLRENGFPVLGWSRSGVTASGEKTQSGSDGLNEVLNYSDILVVLLPLTSGTKGLLSNENLNRLPQHAKIINFARGPIIDDDALLGVLDSGHIDHAVLDVFATEPLPAQHWFWQHPSVTVLPHISAPTNIGTAAKIVCGNVDLYFAKGEMNDFVDRTIGY